MSLVFAVHFCLPPKRASPVHSQWGREFPRAATSTCKWTEDDGDEEQEQPEEQEQGRS